MKKSLNTLSNAICKYQNGDILDVTSNNLPKEFKDITSDDISLNGYSVKYGNMGKIEMPVSV